MLARLLPLLCGALLAASGPVGRVVEVEDADTLVVILAGQRTTVQLYGIDAPENGQAYTEAARQYAAKLALHRDVELIIRDRDKYNRLVGDLKLPNGELLSHRLVAAGYAWWYRKYAPTDGTLAKLEIEARTRKRGLWRDPHAMPPWEWRKLQPPRS